jgi:GNAT superfamily N-acetyltransferase/transposase-like protein
VCSSDLAYRTSVDAQIAESWAGPYVVSKGVLHDTRIQPGFVAVKDNEIVGYILYDIVGVKCEITVLESLHEGQGIGSALINEIVRMAKAVACRRVWLITTNDNTHAIRFYQKFGFELYQVHINTMDKARKLKPQIPPVGNDDIPIKHEFEFEKISKRQKRHYLYNPSHFCQNNGRRANHMERTSQINENCIYCGTKLPESSQSYKRKYCGASCRNKHKLRIKKPGVETKLWQHEPTVFERAMEMYWSGISSAAIARHFGIPVGTMYSWVHDFGRQKERAKPTTQFKEKPIHIGSLKECFRLAQSAEDWLKILQRNANQAEESNANASVTLVCGNFHGQSAGSCAAIVYEKLKEDPLSGKTYAFRNKCGNAITTLSWNEPIYHIARYVKTHGTFIWPEEKLGKSIEVTRSEFEHLISLKKRGGNAEKP